MNTTRTTKARLAWKPDLDGYDDSYIDTWDDCTEEQKEEARKQLREMIESEGVWILEGAMQCPCCGEWTVIDCVGGFVGQDDAGYAEDIKASVETEARKKGLTLEWEE